MARAMSWAWMGLFILAGCGGWGMDRELYEAVRRAENHPTSSPGPADDSPSNPADGSDRSPSAELPAQATVEDYVRLALARNPAIEAARQKHRRLSQRIVQEAALDDPMFMISPIGEMAETAAGMVGTMYGLKQTFPAPGKLNARGHIAAREAEMARAELEKTRLAIEADTRIACWNYYYAEAAIGIVGSDRQLAQQMRDTADARFRAGEAEQGDVLRGSVEVSILDKELVTLRQDRQTAAAMLNSLMNRPVTADLPPLAEAQPDLAEYQFDSLLAAAAVSNPELAGIGQRIEMFRQQLRLARLRRLPDLTVGLNYNTVDRMRMDGRTTSGDDQWWLQFELNIPIWLDKLAAGEREARAGILEASGELADARNRVAFRVRDGLARVQTQQRLIVLFRDSIIPQARQTLDASAASYRAGRTDFLTFADNRRKLLEYQLMYQRSVVQLGKDLADLRREVGGPLPSPTALALPAPPASQPE